MEIDGEIKFAAEWWTGKLREGAKFDSGDSKLSAAMTVFAPRVKPLTDEQIELFRLYLVEEIGQDIQSEMGRLYRNLFYAIHVDYDPDPVLSRAAKRAGIDLRYRLPIKTVLKIYMGRVEVAAGYGRGFETAYQRTLEEKGRK